MSNQFIFSKMVKVDLFNNTTTAPPIFCTQQRTVESNYHNPIVVSQSQVQLQLDKLPTLLALSLVFPMSIIDLFTDAFFYQSLKGHLSIN